jgi:hypothetical protein
MAIKMDEFRDEGSDGWNLNSKSSPVQEQKQSSIVSVQPVMPPQTLSKPVASPVLTSKELKKTIETNSPILPPTNSDPVVSKDLAKTASDIANETFENTRMPEVKSPGKEVIRDLGSDIWEPVAFLAGGALAKHLYDKAVKSSKTPPSPPPPPPPPPSAPSTPPQSGSSIELPNTNIGPVPTTPNENPMDVVNQAPGLAPAPTNSAPNALPGAVNTQAVPGTMPASQPANTPAQQLAENITSESPTNPASTAQPTAQVEANPVESGVEASPLHEAGSEAGEPQIETTAESTNEEVPEKKVEGSAKPPRKPRATKAEMKAREAARPKVFNEGTPAEKFFLGTFTNLKANPVEAEATMLAHKDISNLGKEYEQPGFTDVKGNFNKGGGLTPEFNANLHSFLNKEMGVELDENGKPKDFKWSTENRQKFAEATKNHLETELREGRIGKLGKGAIAAATLLGLGSAAQAAQNGDHGPLKEALFDLGTTLAKGMKIPLMGMTLAQLANARNLAKHGNSGEAVNQFKEAIGGLPILGDLLYTSPEEYADIKRHEVKGAAVPKR